MCLVARVLFCVFIMHVSCVVDVYVVYLCGLVFDELYSAIYVLRVLALFVFVRFSYLGVV